MEKVAVVEEPVEEEVASTGNTQSNVSTAKTETTSPGTATSETSVPAENVPAESVATSDKYTPEEAVAVYRSIMEANGITWDPSIKEFASWGTGYLPLVKGQTEDAANRSVEGMKFGPGDGTSYTRYYLEMNNVDGDSVYYTKWGCN